MVKTLTKHGNSYALIIDRAILELLKITPETPLEVSTDGKTLTITPAADPKRRARFDAAVEKTNRRYGRALKKLAECRSMEPDFLGLAEVLSIHADQIERYGGDASIREALGHRPRRLTARHEASRVRPRAGHQKMRSGPKTPGPQAAPLCSQAPG